MAQKLRFVLVQLDTPMTDDEFVQKVLAVHDGHVQHIYGNEDGTAYILHVQDAAPAGTPDGEPPAAAVTTIKDGLLGGGGMVAGARGAVAGGGGAVAGGGGGGVAGGGPAPVGPAPPAPPPAPAPGGGGLPGGGTVSQIHWCH